MDETKNLRNQPKHGGISFELAAHAVGAAHIELEGRAVLLVVHAYREDHYGEEIIRIISARATEKH